MTRYYNSFYFGDDWTPDSSRFLLEVPGDERAWITSGVSVWDANDAARLEARPYDAWVVVSSGGCVAVVSVDDGVALIRDFPSR
jgi:hypothetical protein